MVLTDPTRSTGAPGSLVAVKSPPSVRFNAPRLTGDPGVWRSLALITRSSGTESDRFMRSASKTLVGGGAGVACAMTAVVFPLSPFDASVEYGDEPTAAMISSRFAWPVVIPRYPCTMGERSWPDSDMAL